MNKPEAIYDLLFIGDRLQQKIGDFSISEVYFFAYLSCLLSIYDGNTVDKWNYTFIKSTMGSPYCSDIQLGLSTLIANNSIVEVGGPTGFYQITEKGSASTKFYSTLGSMKLRTKYLDTACDSLSILPFGQIKNAIGMEPVLSSARNSIGRRGLLEEDNPATRSLRVQFSSLKKALEDHVSDLLVPALVWLDSLDLENQKTLDVKS